MKKSYIKSVIAACAIGCTMSASAQTLHSGYFLDGMVQRHELNAAFGGECNFVVLPAISGTQVGLSTNFGMENYFFNHNGELHTGLSPEISADQFLKGLPANNILSLELNLPITTVGFRGLGGFNTITIKERTFLDANIPSSLFSFLKLGADPATGIAKYDIDNLYINTSSYMEFALGHSRKLDALEGFSYGAKLKFLFGLLGSSLNINHIGIEMSQNQWNISTQGEFIISNMINVNIEDDGSITGVNMSNFGISGFGFGVDLGAVYTPAALPELTVSLALNDIGFNSWSNMNKYVTQENFVFEGFNKIGSTETGSLEEQLNDIVDDMGELIHIEETKPTTHTQSLRTTLNVGAEYAILDRKISFGLLSSTRFGSPTVYAEGMAVVNFRPASWFQASINGSVSTLGAAIGAVINFCPNGANIFIGCDYVTPNMKFSPQGIPVKALRANVCAGVAITFGKRN